MEAVDAIDPMQLIELVRRDPQAGREAVQTALMARAGSDPRLGALMGALAQSQPAPPPREPNPPASPVPRSDSARLRRIHERILELREELDELRRRELDVAAALGACAECWGDDRDCDDCRGRGRPGWRRPDPRAFDEWVRPALARHEAAAGDIAPQNPPDQ